MYIAKSRSRGNAFKSFEKELKEKFWKEHTFWNNGYFVYTIGNISEKTIRKYINEQG